MIFFTLDKNGDGVLDRDETAVAFVPREPEYARMLNERGGFHGRENNTHKFFQPETRTALSKFIRGFVECEISYEKIRQRIMNKMMVKPEAAFAEIDESDKGHLVVKDMQNFLKRMNMYPA